MPLKDLDEEVAKHELEALVIQFNNGFFDFAHLRAFIHRQVDEGRDVYVILHSTQDRNQGLKHLGTAFARCKRLFVHSSEDVARLQSLGHLKNISILPHCVPNVEKAAAQGRTTNEFVIASYGFFLEHKGLAELLEAFAILASEDSRVRLKMVNASYSDELSQRPIEKIRKRIDTLGLGNRVDLITEYLPDKESMEHLVQADLVVFPYQHTTESSSAAVRFGIASGLPVMVTPLPIFDDVASVVQRLPGSDVKSIASGLREMMTKLCVSPGAELHQLQIARERWIDTHSPLKSALQITAIVHAGSKMDDDA